VETLMIVVSLIGLTPIVGMGILYPGICMLLVTLQIVGFIAPDDDFPGSRRKPVSDDVVPLRRAA
jgi:hypothetical protein